MTPNAVTPEGMWWGVDSTGPITASALANVRDWYRDHPTPAVWGRYIVGHFALQPGELESRPPHHIYVYLLVPDQNCSGCGGGNYCGNDRTVEQARVNALAAVQAAEAAHVPTGTTLFKDIEEVGACHGELTSDYLRSWYSTASRSRFRVGFLRQHLPSAQRLPARVLRHAAGRTGFREPGGAGRQRARAAARRPARDGRTGQRAPFRARRTVLRATDGDEDLAVRGV